MMKEYRKTATIRAAQWFKNGEGNIVRHFRHPEIEGSRGCQKCGDIMHNHGWINTLEGGHVVCPGDWIATGVQGEHWPIKPDIFTTTYEEVGAMTEPANQPPTVPAVAEDSDQLLATIRTIATSSTIMDHTLQQCAATITALRAEVERLQERLDLFNTAHKAITTERKM